MWILLANVYTDLDNLLSIPRLEEWGFKNEFYPHEHESYLYWKRGSEIWGSIPFTGMGRARAPLLSEDA